MTQWTEDGEGALERASASSSFPLRRERAPNGDEHLALGFLESPLAHELQGLLAEPHLLTEPAQSPAMYER